MIHLGLVGFGFWGPLLARNFHACAGVRLAAVCDADPARRAEAQHRFPGTRATAQLAELLADTALDAMAIATPATSHFAIVLAALRAGKHVFVEKPLATGIEDAARLVDEAAGRRLTLMVDHTFLFSPPVRHLAELVKSGELGALLYYDAVRTALGRFAPDVGVLWDLAVHDLAVLDQLVGEGPLAIAAQGVAHSPGGLDDIAFLTVRYPGDVLAHLHVNRVAPVKLRRTLVGGRRAAVVWDDLDPVEKLRVFESGVTGEDDPAGEHQRRIGYRVGGVRSPHLAVIEPLAEAVAEFVRAVEGGHRPLSDGETGLRIVRVLAAAEASLARRGAPVDLGGRVAG